MADNIEARFSQYSKLMGEAMEHADRVTPCAWYMKGLLLPGERKSIEPMAARVCPENVPAAHQSMHHLVAASEWSDQSVLTAAAQQVIPALSRRARGCWWIVDDTGHAKKGTHSVGVARQYCGRSGKTDNCQVAVSLSWANEAGSIPLSYRLYLPQEWTTDRKRCERAGVPSEVEFCSKGELARAQIAAAINRDVPRGVVLGDAAYGTEAAFRDYLVEQRLDYVLAIRSNTAVWWGKHQPARAPKESFGRPRTRLIRDTQHQPISVLEVARSLNNNAWRTVSWREGARGKLTSRFARVRVRAAQDNRDRAEEWLLIEWPLNEAEPAHYWLATLPASTSCKQLALHAKARWIIERDYQELKSELGLSHYEGRNWRGFHHHATLCIAAYGFLVLERCRGKKNAARFAEPAVPKRYRPRGSRPATTSRSALHRHTSLPPR